MRRASKRQRSAGERGVVRRRAAAVEFGAAAQNTRPQTVRVYCVLMFECDMTVLDSPYSGYQPLQFAAPHKHPGLPSVASGL